MTRFTVTYEIITEASAENGDVADCGIVADKLTLREAISYATATDSRRCSQSGIEASDSCIENARWFTVYNSMDYLSGNYEHRSLHMPDSITASTRRRIARLLHRKP